MRRLALIAALLVFPASSAFAQTPAPNVAASSNPAALANPSAHLVASLGQQALNILADPAMTHDQRAAKFEQILSQNFDVPRIGRFVMGRYWTQATPPQQQEYQTLFQRWIVIVYTDRLESYSGQTFSVVSSHAEGNGTFVDSQIQEKGAPPVNVGWRVATGSDGRPRIVDVVVEGVSMLVSQRDEFNAIIANNNGDINALINMLKQRIGQN